jgi:membrane protease YdiL (CAAX protease family)
MSERAPGRRLWVYLAGTFAITWSAWWLLAGAARPTASVFDNPLSGILFLVGGFGPTIAALGAVALTPAEGAFDEYASRLLRWRVDPRWWLAALATPPIVAAIIELNTLLAGGPSVQDKIAPLEPLSRLAVLFPMMILGGGLEELGWRGVAQPEFERRYNRLIATALVGAVWALWHLPLFYIPGTVQFGGNFAAFALQVFGTAFLTAWIYGGTRSILLCVLFHAASNAANAMGLRPPEGSQVLAFLDGALRLAIGAALLISLPRPAGTSP